jgi:hypothetical protein
VLVSKPLSEQRRAFKLKAQRQLLVAMIEATSGERFEDKILGEFDDLDPESQFVYACVAVASHFGFSLSRQDLLVASGDRSNEALERLSMLMRTNVLLPASHGVDLVRARHRVIADRLLLELQHRGVLAEVITGLALVGASKVLPGMRSSDPPWRFLRSILNHDFLLEALGQHDGRGVYEAVENLLAWDHHYWLQRGSLELEAGRLREAERYLTQARGIDPDDHNVRNEWAYLLYKRALAHPDRPASRQLAEDARALLRELMMTGGQRAVHSYHVYSSQGLRWARVAMSGTDRQLFLASLLDVAEEGVRAFPQSTRLAAARDEVRKAYLTGVTSE